MSCDDKKSKIAMPSCTVQSLGMSTKGTNEKQQHAKPTASGASSE